LIKNKIIKFETKGFNDIVDITKEATDFASEFTEGLLNVFVQGSTLSVTTIEYEEGVIEDLKNAISRIAPEDIEYIHNLKWGDGNGFSHVRSAILGPSISIPINEGLLRLGTWQQIVVIDFDNRPRSRKAFLSIVN
tara:strand:+ start:386 stop:793 length:408 start_codon:yes stop_codon:yes gene_type:complete